MVINERIAPRVETFTPVTGACYVSNAIIAVLLISPLMLVSLYIGKS
jgi:hypothetical protein